MITAIVCSAPVSSMKAESLVLTALAALSLLSTPSAAQQMNSTADERQPAMVVHLPEQRRPFPEALPDGKTAPGFKIRGIKGWMWRPQQYLTEIPVLARHRMNFMMNCYLSMCDIEHRSWGDPDCNRWWEPLPEEKKKAYEEVVRECARHGIQFCFCLNPNITSKRFANPDNPQDVEDLWQHYHWMQDLGVKWFSICLDDIGQGTDPGMQAKLVNEILRRLREQDKNAQMIFCPTYYFGDGTNHGSAPYLKVLSAALASDVYVFWTGNAVATPRITRVAAERYRKVVGHRLILWDNYPVNDNTPTMNLGPVVGRDPDLCEVVDGYMSNPLCPQNEINRIPMLTCADYAYNPWLYDPDRSIGQVILRMADNDEQRQALVAMVETYPGNLRLDKWYTWNPVRSRFSRLDSLADNNARAKGYLVHMEDLLQRFERAFPDKYLDGRKTLADDVEWMRGRLAKPDRK